MKRGSACTRIKTVHLTFKVHADTASEKGDL